MTSNLIHIWVHQLIVINAKKMGGSKGPIVVRLLLKRLPLKLGLPSFYTFVVKVITSPLGYRRAVQNNSLLQVGPHVPTLPVTEPDEANT